ncbi:MAG: polyprenyl synthetase family protein [Planctomycetota bacterium]|nr:polyprenyl synthetase family protein [Planctomycetota bacterium]
MAEESLDAFLESSRNLVDEVLDRWLPGEPECGELALAMRHIVMSGGKRFRPALVLLGCRDVGGSDEDALGAAAAMEMVHAYSLLHDDLPCMDDASLRRGRPCVHLLYGEAMGVLAGDGLLTLAFEVLARGTPANESIGAMTAALARGAGWDGMVGGQVLDLAAEGCEPDLAQVREIHLGKTAALMATSLRLGALAGGGEAADVDRLELFGRGLGLAFQIVDDVLDESLDPVQMGKDTGADADNNKLTWPGVVGLTQAKADARQLVDESCAHAEGGQATGLLVALAEKVLSRQN